MRKETHSMEQKRVQIELMKSQRDRKESIEKGVRLKRASHQAKSTTTSIHRADCYKPIVTSQTQKKNVI